MNKKVESKQRQKGIGPNIIRAWFDTIMNPLVEALTEEIRFLEKKNWTWFFRSKQLESVRYISSLIGHEAWPNMEQFVNVYPDYKNKFEIYDELVQELTSQCDALHTSITKSSKLLEIYQRTTSSDELLKLDRNIITLFGAYPQEDHLNLIAQYIVNNIDYLPYYYYPAPYWNRYRDEFMTVLGESNIQKLYAITIEVGENLEKFIEDLLRDLKTHREKLSFEYDVPIVVFADQLA